MEKRHIAPRPADGAEAATATAEAATDPAPAKDPFRFIGAPEDDMTEAGVFRRQVAAILRKHLGVEADGASPNLPDLPKSHYDVRDTVVYLVIRLGRALERHLAAPRGREAPTTSGELVLLEALRAGGMVPGRMAKSLGVNASTVTGVADRLEREGLIERAPRFGDARSHVLEPTLPGRHAAEEAANRWRELEVELGRGLRPGELEDLRAALRRVLEILADRRRRE